MSCPSRRDVLRASGLLVAAVGAGCFGDQAPGERASPTPGRTATQSTHQTGTEPEQTATETISSDLETASEEGETPNETTEQPHQTDESAGTETSTPDCTIYDITVHNDMSRTISVSLRILEGSGNEDDEDEGHPVASTPTPTPNVVFSDSFRLGENEWQKYDDIPEREGEHRLEVDVEDGPRETEIVYGREWSQTNEIMVDIHSDDIRFVRGEQGRPPGCD